MSNTESHIPWGSLSLQGLLDGQITQLWKKKGRHPPGSYSRDSTRDSYSLFPQDCVEMFVHIWLKICKTFRILRGWITQFCYSVKSIKEQGVSSVIVRVSLLTKPTQSGLSARTSGHPEYRTDTVTKAFLLSLLQSLTPRLDDLRVRRSVM